MIIDRAEFEKRYNGGNVHKVYEAGRVSIPCHCDWVGCEGWAMRNPENIAEDIDHGRNTQEELDEAIAYREQYLQEKADVQGH